MGEIRSGNSAARGSSRSLAAIWTRYGNTFKLSGGIGIALSRTAENSGSGQRRMTKFDVEVLGE